MQVPQNNELKRPWEMVDTIIFCHKDLSVIVFFRSGNFITGTCSQEKFDAFIAEATVALGSSKVKFE